MGEFVFPAYSERERVVDRWVHFAGITLAPVAVAALLVAGAVLKPFATVGLLAVYGVGLLAMLACSAWYNLEIRPSRRELARRLDHAAIYVMIAGTYTPLAAHVLPLKESAILLALVWAAAALGSVTKLLAPRRFERIGIVAYLLLGWAILPLAGSFTSAATTTTLVLLVLGGVIYTAGVFVHLSRLPYQNAAWHALVLAAAACHFAAVVDTVIT